MTGLHLRVAHDLRRAYWRLSRPLTLGVRGLALDGDRVLLVRHTYMAGWYLPGGGVERGEAVEEALRRELIEEVGLRFEGAPALIGAYSNFHDYKSDHVLLFRVEGWTMAPKPNREIAEHRFFALTEPPPGTSPGTLRRIAEITGKAPPSFRW
jgi:8-oxo-dGTP pyrophosphatase MutT (NUDIX family)